MRSQPAVNLLRTRLSLYYARSDEFRACCRSSPLLGERELAMYDGTRRIKIALLTASNPQNRRLWSGITYYIAQALRKYCGEVTYIGPLPAYKAKLGERILNKSSHLLLKKRYLYS